METTGKSKSRPQGPYCCKIHRVIKESHPYPGISKLIPFPGPCSPGPRPLPGWWSPGTAALRGPWSPGSAALPGSSRPLLGFEIRFTCHYNIKSMTNKGERRVSQCPKVWGWSERETGKQEDPIVFVFPSVGISLNNYLSYRIHSSALVCCK